MRFRNILPVILAMAALSSCSVYRSVPTPDDVYYSPGRAAVEDSYLTVDNNRKGRSYDRYDNSNPDDNYLRMRVRDRNRWSSFDDYSYMNDWQYNGGYNGMYSPYAYGGYGYGGYGYGGYGYGMGMGFGPYAYYNPWSFNSYWNSYYAWNSYYNPYCPGIIVGSYKTNPVVYNSVRNPTSLRSYNNNRSYNTYNNRNSGSRPIYQSNNNGRYNTNNDSYYTNPNSSGGLRRVYQSGSSSNGGYQPSAPSSAPVRSYSPSSSGSSGGGGSRGGGGGGGISRPNRGG